jgi:hypothetical protein
MFELGDCYGDAIVNGAEERLLRGGIARLNLGVRD